MRAITRDRIRRVLEFLAGPELAGRGTDQPGYAAAAGYVAGLLRELELRPMGDSGSFFQRFSLAGSTLREDATGLRLAGGLSLTVLDRDLQIRAYRGPVAVRARPVLLRLGDPDAPIEGDLAGIDRGILIAQRSFAGAPGPIPDAQLAGHTPVVALEVLPFSPYGPAPPRARARFADSTAGADSTGAPLRADGVAPVRGTISLDAWRRLAERCGADAAPPRGRNLAHTCAEEAAFTLERAERRFATMNLVALLEGADPALRREVVALGAHLDHLGRVGDSVFYGADDNGSGVAALVGVARALGAGHRPRRSVLFLVFAGEEMDLVGSRYFTAHPTVPLDRIVAYVNLDMVGRNGDAGRQAGDSARAVRLIVGGPGRVPGELERVFRDANRYVGLSLLSGRNEILGGSDHLSFLERGVPTVFAFTGFHPDYHRPTDTADKINYEKLTNLTRWMYLAVARLADRPLPAAAP